MKLKLSRNKISIIAIILLLGISVPVCTYAAGTGRKNNLKSEGIIDYTNGTQSVCIDSRDLYYLADEIDTVEETAKLGTIQAIQALPDVASATGLSGKTVADINDITFAQLNEAIKISQASSSSPSAPEILSGKVAWANGKKYTGTMPNNGAVGKANLTAGSSYTIPIGYTTGGTVTAATLASQTKGTATAANLSQGVTAWVNGVMLTGTGKDNNSYYTQGKNQGYSEGYDKGVEDVVNDPAGHGINLGTPVMFAASSYPECIASPATVLPAGTYQCVALLFSGTTVNPRAALLSGADSLSEWEAGEVNPADHNWNAWAEMRTHEFTLSEPTVMRCYAGSSTSASNAASFIAVYKTS